MHENTLKVIKAVLIIWGVMWLACWLVEYPHKAQPDSISSARVNRISTEIGFLFGYSTFSIEERLHSINSNDLKAALIVLLETEGGDKGAADLLRRGDGWGRPYHVEWRSNLVDVATSMLTWNDFPLLVWSSGENGVNEYGEGDDLHHYYLGPVIRKNFKPEGNVKNEDECQP
jgi:hypothetical protein